MGVFVITSVLHLGLVLGGEFASVRRVAPRRSLIRAVSVDRERTPSGQPAGETASLAREPATDRELGSMENLFAPRRMEGCTTPYTPHVMCATVKGRVTDAALLEAARRAVASQPMLARRIVGDGQPERHTRIGSVQASGVMANVLPFLGDDMVRVGDPNPLRFAPIPDATPESIVARAVTISDVGAEGDDASQEAALEAAWRARFADELNVRFGEFEREHGPLWRLTVLRSRARTCLVWAFNHAISDQVSANRMLDTFLADAAAAQARGGAGGAEALETSAAAVPPSLEASVLGDTRSVGFFSEETGGTGLLALEHGTQQYLLSKLGEGAAGELPPSVPPLLERAADESIKRASRASAPEFRTLDAPTTKALRARCREAGVTVGALLSAAAAAVASELCRPADGAESPLKVLLGLDMRAFGSFAATEPLCCQAGSLDVVLPCAGTTAAAVADGRLGAARDVWRAARESAAQVRSFTKESPFVRDSVLVFDWATRSFEMTKLLEMEADNPLTLGRAYGAGLSNAGVYGGSARHEVDGASGALELESVFFAVPHALTGALLPWSCLTVDGALHLTLNAADPLVPAAERAACADRLLAVLRALGSEELAAAAREGGAGGAASVAANVALAGACAALALPNLGAWGPLVDGWQRIWAAGAMDADLAPIKFWAFFAAMHPLLKPALWISEVLHSGAWPGPLLGGLVPASFALANVGVLGALGASARLRAAANALLAAAFVGFVSAGVGGRGELTAYNLALDDGVRGCPAVQDIQQPSMKGFDVAKYQGRWYELGFHDWTQFSEVYDTTLDIQLSADGQRWVDDFAVKAPAPLAAPRSWDKSPAANGAHYFLYGKVDPSKPGVLQVRCARRRALARPRARAPRSRATPPAELSAPKPPARLPATWTAQESGFGLTFPNVIVDVQKDARGEYTQALQFQCLERGGVRIFEGINFLSRTPENQDEQLAALHARATAAGLDPYGASVEQVHRVEHDGLDAKAVDNEWQRMWKAIGFDKLLALAESAMHSQAEDILNKVQ